MQIKCFPVGQLQTNCYVVTDEKNHLAAVIDPGAESGRILNYLDDNRLKAEAVFITHGHYDHTGALLSIYEATKAKIYIHALDVNPEGRTADYSYKGGDELSFYGEGDVISVGDLEFRVLETPGHSPGSVTLLCDGHDGTDPVLFTGDTLFRGSCGRTDFPGGSWETLQTSLRRLADLPGDYEVYPGHMDATSLDRERRFNPFLQED